MTDVERIKKLATRDGFIELYFEECGRHETYKDAFEKVNDEYEEIWGRPRYSDYNSFRNSRDRR